MADDEVVEPVDELDVLAIEAEKSDLSEAPDEVVGGDGVSDEVGVLRRA